MIPALFVLALIHLAGLSGLLLVDERLGDGRAIDVAAGWVVGAVVTWWGLLCVGGGR